MVPQRRGAEPESAGATLNGGGGWGQFSSNYDIQSAGAVYTVMLPDASQQPYKTDNFGIDFYVHTKRTQ